MTDPRFIVAARDSEDMDLAREIETLINIEKFLSNLSPLVELIRLRKILETSR